jgi:hypothetical protein
MASWTDSEPGFFALRHELSRLMYRARRRRRYVLGAAALATLMAVGMVLRAPKNYDAQISVRVTEVIEFHMPRSSWTDRELRSFVTQVAFTNEVLARVYQKHLADFAPAANLVRGVERLRDDIGVNTVRNRTLSEVEGTPGPRSAYVVLSFSSSREDRALAVLRELAKPIMETSSRRRRLEAEAEIARTNLQLENAQAVVRKLRDQALARAAAPLPGAGSISPLRMTELDSALKEAHLRVARFQEEKDAALQRQNMEKRKPGIDFEISQESVERPLPRAPVAVLVGVLTFLFALPIAGMVIGAASNTIDSLDDIRRLGLPALGRLAEVAETAPGPPPGGGSNVKELTL